MKPTEEFISNLAKLKAGDLGLLRAHIAKGLDESVNGFDIFTGVWWQVREKSAGAPRREVSWLVMKLYAFRPLEPVNNDDFILPRLLGKQAYGDRKSRIYSKFDELVQTPLNNIEPALQWALSIISEQNRQLNWVHLTDTLSIWEDTKTRRLWTEQLLNINQGEQS